LHHGADRGRPGHDVLPLLPRRRGGSRRPAGSSRDVGAYKYFRNQAAAASAALSNAFAVASPCVAPSITVTPVGPFIALDAAMALPSLFTRVSRSATMNRIAVASGTCSANQNGW